MNNFAGEQYGYALLLHQLLAAEINMRFLWQDIMCRYWPWLRKVVETFPERSSLGSRRPKWDGVSLQENLTRLL